MDLLIKIIKRFWIINCFGIFVLSACTPASSQEKLLTSEEGNFSILMPVNQARKQTERIIDLLYEQIKGTLEKKPRTYR
ncbi:hypothetical protein [uncultured Nostoc sp.]|uniref:hypothetical protein n=1 Tax=uncultured Nostoc sp. TaxID=340711 RepID=UPI0035C9BDE6